MRARQVHGLAAPSAGTTLERITRMVIALATDSTGADAAAALHALALASIAGAKIISVHAGPEDTTLDSVLETARRWGRPIDHEFHRSDCCDDVVDSLVQSLRALQPDVVVVGTHARHGLSGLVHGSVAGAIIRNIGVPVLVVPNTCRPFITPEGSVDVPRILIPARNDLDATRADSAAHYLLGLLGRPHARLVHTDAPLDAVLRGPALDASLVVMTTHGHDGIADVLLGSHTEHVIREATCPILCVPS